MSKESDEHDETQGESVTTVECTRLNAAYRDLRENPGQDRYLAVLEALEAGLREDVYCFIPVQSAMPAAVEKNGRIQWNVMETPTGRMLSVFTCREEVEKHPAPASVGIRLRAALQMALSSKNLSGILLNPMDGHHGIPVERRNLEILAARLQGGVPPQLNPGVVSNAVYRLWEIAVGVPTTVYDVSAEVKKLGGMGKLLKPLLEKWQTKLQKSKDEFPEPLDYAKAVLRNVISSGFVYGAMALKNPDLALDVDIEKCIDAIPDLRGDIGQNLDEYLTLISDAVRSGLKEPNEAHVQLLIVCNLLIIAFGAFNFGLGWGMAKDAESRGAMALAELRDRQQAWIEKFKQEVIEKMEKKNKEAKENPDDEVK